CRRAAGSAQRLSWRILQPIQEKKSRTGGQPLAIDQVALVMTILPTPVPRSGRFPLRLLQGRAQHIERKLKLRNGQQAEAETEHPRLFAEPFAIADTAIEGGERRMKAGDGSVVELVWAQAYATERAGVGLDPFYQRCVVRNPRRGARKTFAEM